MKHKIFMVGTTHFDPVWMWKWDEGMASIRSTFRAALERMKEDAGFIYSFSCPAVFEWIKEVDPPLLAEIKQRVNEGRWELVEGWWLQPDCTLLSGESYVRHGLYGQRYLLENFGKTAKSGFNTDSFGHTAMLPQIYRKSGVDSYVFGRPGPKDAKIPGSLFIWESPDGSRILAFRAGGDGANAYPRDTGKSIEKLGANIDNIGHDMLLIYGVSNHGGAPTKKAITEIRALMNDSGKSYDLAFGSVAEFSGQQDRETLPVFGGEMLVRAYGVFSNNTEVKRNNRRCEYALLNAERFAWAAMLLAGRQYPAEALTKSWQDTLFNQFHDIMDGVCVRPAFFDVRNLHGRVLQTTGEIIHYSLQAMTRTIDTSKEGFPLVVWNPNTFDVETPIEAEFQWPWEFDWYDGPLTVRDSKGNIIPCQIIQELSALPKFRSRCVFRDTVPSLGYKLYYVSHEAQPAELSTPMDVAETMIENRRYKIVIDRETGGIASVYDKRLHRKVMSAAAQPVVLEDKSDSWGMSITELGGVLESFKLESVAVIENGPVRAAIRTKARRDDSILVQTFILYKDSDAIEGTFKVHWRNQRQMLKLCFTPEMKNPIVTSAIPYGAAERPDDGREVPAGEWLDLSEGGLGAAILTDSMFAYNVKGATAGMTVLRSCIFAHHPLPPEISTCPMDETKDWEHQEQGVREGAWKLVFHDGDWRKAQIPKHAAAFNNPVITIDEMNHPGDRPGEDSFLKVEANNSLVTVLKKAEDDSSVIIRMYEYAGETDEVKITIKPLNREIRIPISKHEIKTIKLDQSPDGRLVETDMLERE